MAVKFGQTENGEEVQGYTCPQCKKFKPLTDFQGKPYDTRCVECIPRDRLMELADKVQALAMRKASQLMDLAESDQGLKPVEKMLTALYARWGGYNAYVEDLSEGVKRLYDTGKVRDAVNAQLRLLQIHTKIDKMKQEEDWHLMDDAAIQAALQRQLAKMIVEGGVSVAQDQLKGIKDAE